MKYRLYGLVFETDLPLRHALPEATTADGPADVFVSVATEPVDVPETMVGRRFESYDRLDDGQPVFCVDEYPHRTVLAFPNRVQYHLVGGGHVIVERLAPVSDALIELHVLGLVLSFMLERKGILALRASAVARRDGAIVFLAFGAGGTSTLASTFVQSGEPLLTDDVLAVRSAGDHSRGAPGFPSVHLWPEQARQLGVDARDFERMLPGVEKRIIPVDALNGGFCTNEQPIVALFVPERDDDADAAIAIERMPPSEAFRIVLTNGFVAQIAEASGMLRSRFAAITHLVGVTPVYRLRYPSGSENLPAVRQAIIDRLERED